MNYEKKYKEALERARELQENSNGMILKKWLWGVFPELNPESEDERIREAIIDFLGLPHPQFVGKRDHEKWIAWLEKQNKLDNNDTNILNRFSFYSYKDEPNILYLSELYVNKEQRNRGIGTKILKIADKVAVEMKYNLIRLKTEIGSNAERLYRKNGYNFLKMEGNQVWLEKQCDPADKIKPKFHEDDWVACKELNTARIINIEGDKYEVEFIDGSKGFPHIEWVDRNLHLWTIQDAMDGDVLVDSYSKDSLIILYKGINKEQSILAHCGWNGYNFSIKTNGLGYGGLDNTNYLPATKEQRDLLFQKMKEAGYEWDSEKKEVKKIEGK